MQWMMRGSRSVGSHGERFSGGCGDTNKLPVAGFDEAGVDSVIEEGEQAVPIIERVNQDARLRVNADLRPGDGFQ